MANQTGAFKDKGEQFGNKMGEAFPEGKEGVDSVISGARERVSDMTSHLGEKARDVASKAKQTASDAYQNVDSLISERPMQSFLIGLGVGCVVGITLTSIFKR